MYTRVGDDILADEELLGRESALRHKTHAKSNAFTNHDAGRHFNEGVVRRHYMLQESRLFLCKHCSPSRKEALSVYEATKCAIQLNAYYLNLRGILDNLAWVLQYEWQLLPDVVEDGKGNQSCYLFGKRFLDALQSRHAKLASVLHQYGPWKEELAALRDPAAHRVPIYVAPGVATSQEQVDKWNRIMAQVDVDPAERGNKSLTEIHLEAQAVVDFVPVMWLSTRRGWVSRPIHAQVRSDHDKYLTIASAIVDEL